MARGIVGYSGGNPIYGEVPDPQPKPGGDKFMTQPGGRMPTPIAPGGGTPGGGVPGGGAGGNMPDPRLAPPITSPGTPSPGTPPQPSVPVPSTPITTPPPVQRQPTYNHPGNRRWREARARGMTREQFQGQGAQPTQAPNTAQLNPAPAPTPDVQAQPVSQPQPAPQGGGVPGKPPMNPGPARAYPDDQARVQAQRRYLGGGGRPAVNRY